MNNIKSYFSKVDQSIKHSETVIMAGRCRVVYRGRARSSLESGDRVIVMKQDGTLLVHRPVGLNPVNWMPANKNKKSHLAVSLKKNELRVKAVRSTPPETVEVFFDIIYFVESMLLRDRGDFTLHLSEEEMRSTLVKKPEIIEKGFRIIEYEKKVDPGFIDLYCSDKKGNIVVIEIKKNPADKAAALQLKKYLNSMEIKAKKLRGIIVAPALKKGTQKTIDLLGLEFRQLSPKTCLNLMRGEESVEHQLYEWFNNKTGNH